MKGVRACSACKEASLQSCTTPSCPLKCCCKEPAGGKYALALTCLQLFKLSFAALPALQVDSVIGDRCPTLEDIRALRFTTRVINESMRLYPQPPVLIRRALEEDTLGGFPLKKGADMFISVWNIHRSAPKALHKLDGTSRQLGACERLCSVG